MPAKTTIGRKNKEQAQRPTASPKPKKLPSGTNAEEIRREEMERREQTYNCTLTEHQRSCLIRRLEIINSSARNRPENELLDYLRGLKPNPKAKTPAKRTRTRSRTRR